MLSAISLYSGCDLPHDADDSWEEAGDIGLQVGIVPRPPFTMHENGEWKGEEVDLLKGFATDHGLSIEFNTGSESELIHRLERSDVHMLVGGFSKDTEWKKVVGATRPFPPMEHVILVAPGENRMLTRLEKWLIGNTP